ncbi:hypothetical protein KDA11_06650 [Candidatus Saccharibacteria bacterium]|nr:hypothetical protein [Candidatus Saccharibacteria bacterium]
MDPPSSVPGVVVIGVSVVLIVILSIIVWVFDDKTFKQFALSLMPNMIAGLVVGVMLTLTTVTVVFVQKKVRFKTN